MAEVVVRWQAYFDTVENITVGVHRIRLMSSTSDHLRVSKNLEDVRFLSETENAAVPTFYQYGTPNGDRVAIDGGTVGSDHWVITKHRSISNSGSL